MRGFFLIATFGVCFISSKNFIYNVNRTATQDSRKGATMYMFHNPHFCLVIRMES